MDLTRCKTVIVFGGSFDPPHVAHTRLPRLVMERIGADAVAYVPAAQSPLKAAGPRTAVQHRLAMLHLALDDCDHAMIVTDEINRTAAGQPSYMVDTLEGLRRQLGGRVQLRLLIGSDQLRQFDRWKASPRVIELAEPLVMVRAPATIRSILAALPAGYRDADWAPRLIEVKPMRISSSMIRRRMATGHSLDHLVTEPVAAYIRKHRLYAG